MLLKLLPALSTWALALLDEALEASIVEVLWRAGLVGLVAEGALGVAIARRHQRLVGFGIDGLCLSLQELLSLDLDLLTHLGYLVLQTTDVVLFLL